MKQNEARQTREEPCRQIDVRRDMACSRCDGRWQITYWSPKADLQAFKVSLKRFSACAFLPATFHSPAKRFAEERESLLLGPLQIEMPKGGEK